jgi:hypothetical protein
VSQSCSRLLESGGWFVEEEQLRLFDHADGEIQTALHAAGVRCRSPVARIGEAEAGEQLVDPPRDLPPEDVTELGHHLEVLPSGQ